MDTAIEKKEREIELLKKLLKRAVLEAEHYKRNWLMARAKYRVLESELLHYKFGIRRN